MIKVPWEEGEEIEGENAQEEINERDPKGWCDLGVLYTISVQLTPLWRHYSVLAADGAVHCTVSSTRVICFPSLFSPEESSSPLWQFLKFPNPSVAEPRALLICACVDVWVELSLGIWAVSVYPSPGKTFVWIAVQVFPLFLRRDLTPAVHSLRVFRVVKSCHPSSCSTIWSKLQSSRKYFVDVKSVDTYRLNFGRSAWNS